MLAERIKKRAVEIGFHKVGIVAAEPLIDEGERLTEWLERGFHGEMAWIAREPAKRVDPSLIFLDAKSVVVCALNYFTPHKHQDKPDTGKISRYAWGDDYHDVVGEKLRSLLEWIKSENPTADGKICVDTAPMMDKAWAVRAGLGWIGKHSNLITKELGSWVFIGEIILNLELEAHEDIVEDHCGSCTACLDACPTNAIVEPYVVESRSCISYATIELRDAELPPAITENLDGWLYGCDICQDVCPWNRFEKQAEEARFQPRHGETEVNLDEVISLTPEGYAARFRGSAMKRTKLAGMKRNAQALKNKLL
ncbi:MAG: tRNA epoxyqueuosine(34) reductase QueG [Acidobacteriota bacterium]